MPQVYVDPDRLEEFANKLVAFSQELNVIYQVLDGKLKALGSTWRDQEYEKFVNNFNESRKTLRDLLSEIEAVHPKIRQDVATIREYLQR